VKSLVEIGERLVQLAPLTQRLSPQAKRDRRLRIEADGLVEILKRSSKVTFETPCFTTIGIGDVVFGKSQNGFTEIEDGPIEHSLISKYQSAIIVSAGRVGV
jgi:hypothetical protein